MLLVGIHPQYPSAEDVRIRLRLARPNLYLLGVILDGLEESSVAKNIGIVLNARAYFI